MEGITKHGSVKRSIEILERDKEQTLKTLWGKEKLDDFFPRQELVNYQRCASYMRSIVKRHGKREKRAIWGMQERQPRRKSSSTRKEQWARKLDGAAIDKEHKILYVLEFKRTTDICKEKSTKKEQGCGQKSSMRT